MELTLVKCSETHIEPLLSICEKTFREAFESQNDPVDFEHYLSVTFNRETISKELADPHMAYYLVYEGPQAVAYFKLNEEEAQTDLKSSVSIELERIYVVQEQQGKKIGERLLAIIKSLAGEKGKEFLWLGVWEKNEAAIRFYERHGYQKFGTHPYYIGSDKQTDWLMTTNLIG